MPASDLVFLIHGVGNAEQGAFVKDARPVLHSFGLDESCVLEINWHSIVGYPTSSSRWRQARITSSYLAAVMAALRTAGTGLSLNREGFARRATLRITGLAADALVLLWCILPLFLFQGMLAGTADRIPVVFEASLWLLAALVATALLAGIVFGLVHGEVGSLRRLVFVALRPVIFAALILFLIPLGGALAELAAIIATTWTVVAVFLPLLLGEFRLTDTLQFAQVGGYFATALAGLGLIAALSLVLVFAPVLKIVSDVIRYAGDAEYRERLHAGVLSAAKAAGPIRDRRVFLVGHSLGSVIAVNSLLRHDSPWNDATEVILVTMGSPLRKLFHRFFPESCPDPAGLGHSLLTQGRISSWVNVYRPFDPVGTSLFHGRPVDIRLSDRSTRQFGRLSVFAHVGYWKDAKVARLVAESLPGPVAQHREEPRAAAPAPLFQSASPARATPDWVYGLALLGIPLALVWLFVSHSAIEPSDQWKRVTHIARQLEQDADTIQGTVKYRPRTRPGFSDTWSVRFDPDGRGTRSFWVDETKADMRELQDRVGFGRPKSRDFRIIFSPADPELFVLSDIPPSREQAHYRPTLGNALFRTIRHGIMPAVLFGLLGALAWGMYLGHPVDDEEKAENSSVGISNAIPNEHA